MKKLKRNLGGEQLLLITPPSDWKAPGELPDLRNLQRIAVDLECRDNGLSNGKGPGWAIGDGDICGVSIAWRDNQLNSHYFPISHPDSRCFPVAALGKWLKDHMKAGVKFTFHNGPYDAGWINWKWDLPPTYKIDDTCCMAYMVDENRMSYSLNALCKWRNLSGKDETLLREAAASYQVDPKNEMWKLPARYVGPYAEQDALCTLQLAESLESELEEVREAYDLEMDLLPMVHAMRLRGIRINEKAAEQAYRKFKNISNLALKELSILLRENVTIDNIRSNKWLEDKFNACRIPFPRTVKTDSASFEAKWMRDYDHPLPQKIVRAKKFEEAAEKFIKNYIMDFLHNGRLHASVHQYRSENLYNDEKYGGGTRTYRFSYSDPPLQQIPHRDEELATDIRRCFIPEKREEWLRADFSQQEFRLMVHYAEALDLTKAAEAAERYRNEPDTDFHQMVAEMTGLERKAAKDCNFAKAYGAGVRKFAFMTKKSEAEAMKIMEQYEIKMPFVKQLYDFCQRRASERGYIKLLDGARVRFDFWAAKWRVEGTDWTRHNHMADCLGEEARRRAADPSHPWYGQKLRRSRCNKGMNSLIQGGAARQTKLAMRACWQAGLVPLLQVHDELCFSVPNRNIGGQVASLMCNAVPLRIPMRVDLAYGASWAGK